MINKIVFFNLVFIVNTNCQNLKTKTNLSPNTRTRISINDDWRFMRYNGESDKLIYDIRPEVSDRNDSKVADSKPTEAVQVSQEVADKNGLMVPDANLKVNFSLEGAGEIVATDNGDPANLVSFASHEREAYNGLAKKGSKGIIKLTAQSDGLEACSINIKNK